MQELNRIVEQISKTRADYMERRSAIKSDETLSERGKSDKLAEVYQQHRSKYETLRADLESKRAEVGQSLKQRAFSANTSTAADSLAFDDVVYRMRNADPAERRERLENASSTTGTAIALAAYLKGDNSTVDEYAAKFKKADSIQPLVDYDEAWNPERMSAARKMQVNMALHFPQKAE